MGNIFSVSISIEDLVGRCCDCAAVRANYICKLQENRATLRTELQKLRELKNDVNRKVDVAERQQMKRLDQVQGWFSRVEATDTEVRQQIEDGAETIEEKRLCGSYHPKYCISSYKLGKKVVRKLEQVANLISEGRNFEVVADSARCYICELEENQVTLRTELQKLRELRNDVKRKVDLAERQQMKPRDQVLGWISRVEAMETEVGQLTGDGAETIEEKRLCSSSHSKHCIVSYNLGKKVVKKLEQVARMSKGCNFEVVADIVPPAPVVEIPSISTVGLESTFDKVWSCLGEEHVGMIGLYGLGGVGKTTLLTQINNHFLKTSHNFDVVIWVVVSKTPNLEQVQNEIWEKVGVCDNKWKNKSHHEKAKDIWKTLSKKSFVMLLDDMWEQMDLLDVGIPPPDQQNKSKLIFTTRSQDLCSQMGADKKIQVQCLAWKDSWDLFKKYVGEETLNSDPEIPELAKMVAEECCGLPLVIITIGRAMASKATPQEWKHAIRVLKASTSKFPGMGDPVYPRLKYSYDSLPSKIVQSCFLYCSLFPEDTLISKNKLIWGWICEGLLDEFDDTDGAKNQGFSIISTLVHACLLEEASDSNFVKLHDVMRDMALWITSEMGEMKDKFLVQTRAGLTQPPEFVKWTKAERISLMDNRIEKLTGSPTCPNLLTLLLDFNRDMQMISNGFFQFMPNLRVLSLSRTKIVELPSDIFNLVSLEFLNLSWTNIKKLPVEMKNLVKLKCLNLWGTSKLSSIPRGLISSLSMLQMVDMYELGVCDEVAAGSIESDGNDESLVVVEGSIESDGNDESLVVVEGSIESDGNDESLVEELESLEYLTDLSITIASASVLERFLSSRKLPSCTRGIMLKIFKGSSSLNLSSLENLKHLTWFRIQSFDSLREINFDWAGKGKQTVEYNNLNPKVKCFHCLHEVYIYGCQMLKNMTWLIFAPNITFLTIGKCDEMEEVIGKGVEDGGNLSPFTKLMQLRLYDLPQLKSVYWNSLSFPNLEGIRVDDCPKLKKLPLNSNSAKERRVVIIGEEEWWNELEWEDEDDLNTFLPRFQKI